MIWRWHSTRQWQKGRDVGNTGRKVGQLMMKSEQKGPSLASLQIVRFGPGELPFCSPNRVGSVPKDDQTEIQTEAV